MKKFNWKKYLDTCLESTDFCCMATVDKKSKVWSNPVYFAWDNNYNIYLISMLKSRHMQNLATQKNISVSIYSTDQKPGGDVFGIQLEGEGRIVDDLKSVKEAYKVYFKRRFPKTGIAKSKKPEDCIGPHAVWKFVKITPKSLYYFDTRFFDEERQSVPKKIYK